MSLRWSASLIAPDRDFDGAPLLRTEFLLAEGHGELRRARLHLTALGILEASLNGHPVSDHVLVPGWSSYEWRLRYRSYDLLDLVRPTSVLGIALGNGWFRGRLGFRGGVSNIYGSELGALAQLELTFADGHRQVVVTDDTWTAGPTAVTANQLYDGQTIDARRRSDAWLQPGFASPDWTGVHVVDHDPAKLVPATAPPVRRVSLLHPVEITSSPSGRVLVDFGQNFVGWVRVTVRGPAGSTITLRHAEVLEEGELGVRPLRTAEATDRFVLSGEDDVFEPTLTFHGFRYAEVDGWPGGIDALRRTPGALTGVVVSSDLVATGEFACSDELLNQFHRNVVWSTRGNFLDVPTDCPQRDERLGWTGDIAAFAPSACFLFDTQAFLESWLADLAAEQQAADGVVPYVVPDLVKYIPAADFPPQESTAIWGDAAVWVPWALWQAYGDPGVLAKAFDSMAAHLRRVESLLSPTGLWDRGFQFGDWLDPTAPPDRPIEAKADSGVVATACLYHSARLVAEAAVIIDRLDDAAAFAALAERTRRAFQEHYVTAGGRITSDAPTVYALAIVFLLLDAEDQRRAGRRLAELVAAGGHHIQTGFAGTPFIADALTRTGHLGDAYALLTQQECPSWLYPVTMGATTVWERWDSMLPDGTINPGQMTSFNHYALGAVADWMHRTIGGIAPAEPGYSRVLVAPRPGGGLGWARASLQSRHGRIAVAWEIDGAGHLRVDVEIPDGVTASVRLPGRAPLDVGAGHHVFDATEESGAHPND